MKKQDKRRKERRVLIAALFTAGVITAGSTFAWFTSKDEVTNRLSASASYNVSIAEDFQPPEDWIPGQTVNKDVSAVNTGNVDAFVRMWLEGEMSIVKRLEDENCAPVDSSPTLVAATDQRMIDLGFTFYEASGDSKIFYKELSTVKRDNPSNNDPSSQDTEEDNKPAQFSEVQSMQAGGFLASCPDGANYSFKVEQATTIEAYATASATEKTVINLKAGDIVATKSSSVTGAAAYLDNGTACINIDSSEFQPETEGLYLFRRIIDLNPSSAVEHDEYAYSGYYYVPAEDGVLTTDGKQHYFALCTDDFHTSQYVIPSTEVTETFSDPGRELAGAAPKTGANGPKFCNAAETVVENDELKWNFVPAAGEEPAKLIATYDGGNNTGETPVTADDIKIEIALANLGDSDQTWTRIEGGANHMDTFYYNDDVEAGDTTAKLVDSVKLSGDTTQEGFLAFDFDLNVFLDSIQVTLDEAGNEGFDAVKGGWAVADGSSAAPASASQTVGAPEINKITWSAS